MCLLLCLISFCVCVCVCVCVVCLTSFLSNLFIYFWLCWVFVSVQAFL